MQRRKFIQSGTAIASLPLLGFSQSALAASNVTGNVQLYIPYLPSHNNLANGQVVYAPYFWGPSKGIHNYRFGGQHSYGPYFDAPIHPYLYGGTVNIFAANAQFGRRIRIPYTQDWGSAYFDSEPANFSGILSGNQYIISGDESHYNSGHWPFSPYVYQGNVYVICYHEYYPDFNQNAQIPAGWNNPTRKIIIPIVSNHRVHACNDGFSVNWVNAITLLKSTDGGRTISPDPANGSSSQSHRCILTPMPSGVTKNAAGQTIFEDNHAIAAPYGFFHPTNLISETVNGQTFYYIYAQYRVRQKKGIAFNCNCNGCDSRSNSGYVAIRTQNPSSTSGWEMFGKNGTWETINKATWQGEHIPGVGGQEPYILFEAARGWQGMGQMFRYLITIRKVGNYYVGLGCATGAIGFIAVTSLADPRAWEDWGKNYLHVANHTAFYGMKPIRKGGLHSNSVVAPIDFNPPEAQGVNYFHPSFFGTNQGIPYDVNFEYINPLQGAFLFGTYHQESLTHAVLHFSGF